MESLEYQRSAAKQKPTASSTSYLEDIIHVVTVYRSEPSIDSHINIAAKPQPWGYTSWDLGTGLLQPLCDVST